MALSFVLFDLLTRHIQWLAVACIFCMTHASCIFAVHHPGVTDIRLCTGMLQALMGLLHRTDSALRVGHALLQLPPPCRRLVPLRLCEPACLFGACFKYRAPYCDHKH